MILRQILKYPKICRILRPISPKISFSMTTADISQQLSTVYDPREAQNIAQWLVEYLTGCSPLQQRLENTPLTESQIQQAQSLLAELLQQKPLQYVLGESYFWNLKLLVSPAVLIPRPETEELVAWIQQTFTKETTFRAIDIGTGSGCIAIALQQLFPLWSMTAADISADALSIAQQNAKQYQQNIQFIRVDITDIQQYDLFTTYNLIVSNPPYIPLSEKESLGVNVVNYEPHQALFTPNDQPTLFYEAILQFADTHLAPKGHIFFELHENFAQKIVALCHDKGYCNTELRQDLNGKGRMLHIWKV